MPGLKIAGQIEMFDKNFFAWVATPLTPSDLDVKHTLCRSYAGQHVKMDGFRPTRAKNRQEYCLKLTHHLVQVYDGWYVAEGGHD